MCGVKHRMSSFVDSVVVVAVVAMAKSQNDAVPGNKDSRPHYCDRQVAGISLILVDKERHNTLFYLILHAPLLLMLLLTPLRF